MINYNKKLQNNYRECPYCKKILTKYQYKFCSSECSIKQYRLEKPINHNKTLVICKTCNKEFYKYNFEIDKTSNNFCSRSCAAKYNNSIKPKRIKKQRFCKICKIEIKYEKFRTLCVSCYNNKFRFNKTSKDYINKHRFNTTVRFNAHVVYNNYTKENKCVLCNYNLHTEICHIKSVSSFSEESTISEINHIDNLVRLCPNHHWELDHGILALSDVLNKK